MRGVSLAHLFATTTLGAGCTSLIDVDARPESADGAAARVEDAAPVSAPPSRSCDVVACPPLDCSAFSRGVLETGDNNMAVCVVEAALPRTAPQCDAQGECIAQVADETTCARTAPQRSLAIDGRCAAFADCAHADLNILALGRNIRCNPDNAGTLGYCDGTGACTPCVPVAGGLEVCNQLDDDCDGAIDESETRMRPTMGVRHCCNPPPDRGGDPNQPLSFWCCSPEFGGSMDGRPGDCCIWPMDAGVESYEFRCPSP